MSLTDLLDRPPSRAAAETYLYMLLPQLANEMPWASDRDEQRIHLDQACRIVAVVLHRGVAQADVDAAIEACGAINKINNGGDLVDMYGYYNSPENRDYWLSYEQQNLTNAIRDLTSGIPERNAA